MQFYWPASASGLIESRPDAAIRKYPWSFCAAWSFPGFSHARSEEEEKPVSQLRPSYITEVRGTMHGNGENKNRIYYDNK